MTLETQVERFNTRQLFRSIWNSSVVSSLRFGCAGLANHLDRFAVSRSPAWSPIVKIKKSYSGLLTRTLFMLYIRDGTGTGSRLGSFTARTGLPSAGVIVAPQ